MSGRHRSAFEPQRTQRTQRRTTTLVVLLCVLCGSMLSSCREKAVPNTEQATAKAAASGAPCGGLTLPAGFCATVFADSVGHARHIVVAPNGDVYVNTWSGSYYPDSSPLPGGFLVALRDTNRDGRADVVRRFGATGAGGGHGGTGIALYHGALYAEEGGAIVRYP